MRRLRQWFSLVMICGLALVSSSCAHFRASDSRHKPVQRPPAGPRRVGGVRMVNLEMRFVLIDAGTMQRLSVGRELHTMHYGVETGVVRVSPESRRPFVAADIVSGTPGIGDDAVDIPDPKAPEPADTLATGSAR